MQRRCAEILTRLRKAKNSVWFNSPFDVEGLKLLRLHGHTRLFCGACSSAAMAGAAVGDGGRQRRDEEATRKERRGCLPFLLGIGEMLLGIEKKYKGKGDKKSIC